MWELNRPTSASQRADDHYVRCVLDNGQWKTGGQCVVPIENSEGPRRYVRIDNDGVMSASPGPPREFRAGVMFPDVAGRGRLRVAPGRLELMTGPTWQ
jgi:hypothetical protein